MNGKSVTLQHCGGRGACKTFIRFLLSGATSGLWTSSSSWWAAGCARISGAVQMKSDKRNQQDPNKMCDDKNKDVKKKEKNEEEMTDTTCPGPVSFNGQGQPTSRKPRGYVVGFGRFQRFRFWVQFWCLVSWMWSLSHASAFELSSSNWGEITGHPNGPPSVAVRVAMQPWQRTRADFFHVRDVPPFAPLDGVERLLNSSSSFDVHGGATLPLCSLADDAWRLSHEGSYMTAVVKCKCSQLTSFVQKWAYPLLRDSMHVWAYPFSERAVDDDNPLMMLLWLAGMGCLAWGWDSLCRVDDLLVLGNSLLQWFLDYLWGPVACFFIFQGFLSARPSFPFSWVYPCSSPTFGDEALSHLGWLFFSRSVGCSLGCSMLEKNLASEACSQTTQTRCKAQTSKVANSRSP